jgi:hypothetical protein
MKREISRDLLELSVGNSRMLKVIKGNCLALEKKCKVVSKMVVSPLLVLNVH